jgi:hypothetical protein
MPKNAAHLAARPVGGEVASTAPQARVTLATLPSGRQAMNLSTSSLY